MLELLNMDYAVEYQFSHTKKRCINSLKIKYKKFDFVYENFNKKYYVDILQHQKINKSNDTLVGISKHNRNIYIQDDLC